MKIALASARVRNNDLAFNLSQMRRWMAEAKQQGAELICFGESCLQGFDAFSWSYENDRTIAVSTEDEVFRQLLADTQTLGIDVLFGFLEREGETLYSSCALLGGGQMLHLYRRVSKGWKEYTRTDHHYQEGDTVQPFAYRGKQCLIALCGDLWDDTAPRFHQQADVLFWPLYINFSLADWTGEANERQAYADKAGEFGGHVLLINSMDDPAEGDYPALGGCCHYWNGTICEEVALGCEGLLMVEI